ncbi:MAG: TIGR00730 family Rossman fold protein [Gemmatimonadota bacterium]|nr:TIGR00730 family Rossman fold protein [Gemmatimonadota bacterium]
MKHICVFCASNPGIQPGYMQAARELGELIATRGATVLYGGGGTGLMGALADGALGAGGRVVGVMPHALVEREAAHRSLSELHIVNSMHDRKAMLAELADGYVALPGGIGTLEELFEAWTWAQLGVHNKPIGLLNVQGYWNTLTKFFDQMGSEGFLRSHTRDLALIDDVAERLLHQMDRYVPPVVTQWVRLPEL